MRHYIFVVALASISTSSAFAQDITDFQSFTAESSSILALINCPSPRISKEPGLPDLWGCVLPPNDVVKVFINSDDGGAVLNVKIMWNDWTKDIGYGVHTDKKIAEAWVAAMSTRYAPENVADILTAFGANSNAAIQSQHFDLKYTYFRGPAIDERLITIISRQLR